MGDEKHMVKGIDESELAVFMEGRGRNENVYNMFSCIYLGSDILDRDI